MAELSQGVIDEFRTENADLTRRLAEAERERDQLLASVTDQLDTERASLAAGVCDWMTLEAELAEARAEIERLRAALEEKR